jgi:hypothetical protein
VWECLWVERRTERGHTWRVVEETPPGVDELNSCFIHIEYEGRPVLVVLLARDGSINRMGNGTVNPEVDDTWYIGKVEEPLFDQLMMVVPNDILEYAGAYDPADRRGIECKCTIMFGHEDGRATQFEISYGSESEGPPLELQTIIRRAVELTDPWWKAQPNEANLLRLGKPKPWRFGKPHRPT